MSFLLLIIEPRGQRDTRTEDEGKQLYADMVRFGEGLAARGLLRASESLRADQHGVRVQLRDGKTALRDGPFTEAKEMVGGFYLLDGVTREEAVAIASACPAAQWATVEVREIAPCYAN
ncbi:PhnB protein [Sulfuriferula multivorans]|uniref:PhnB protein n=1 Tax=Sulfuriferula multivorans TaxID=1559896 RepID=A0A401JAD8_9PROT|nr:YciI family protein [Sulfuriferula multivorans]GBL44530.1 PhnB protein [Sulfuriferula multivorans]